MKPSFKMKPFFKQALKMLVMFVGMFMLMFTILMIVVVVTAHAAEPQTESTTSVEQTENGLEESEEETEAPSRTGGGHHVNDTEKVTVEVSDKSKDNGEKKILKKFEKLYEKNSDIAGWLTIDGTTIDYPVMYTPDDNDYYLHLDFDKNWSDPGTPFIDTNCRPFDDRTDNVLIYGHNMKSGVMFRELLQYEDESFYKKHKNIKFDTLYETGTYEVIGAFRSEIYPDDDTEHYHYYEFFNAADKAEFDEYIDFVKSNTSYDSGVTAEYGDELITLSTCASHTEDGRFVVVARRITGDDK